MADDQNNPLLIAEVIIDQKIPLILSYHIPLDMENSAVIGARCEVPFRDKIQKGFIIDIKNKAPTKALKSILAISSTLSLPPKLLELALWMSRYYVTPLTKVLHFFTPRLIKSKGMESGYTHASLEKAHHLELIDYITTHHKRKKKALEFVKKNLLETPQHSVSDFKKQLGLEIFEICLEKQWLKFSTKSTNLDFEPIRGEKKTLTSEQLTVASKLKESLKNQRQSVHLIHGVCGSGKTEVYFEAIEEALHLGLGIIYMVPEVSLAPQTITRLKKRFLCPIALIHHQIADGMKKKDFEDLQNGAIHLVVGARSSIFAPVKNLGLVIIDEEHESAYKQEGMPTYHAKDVAIMRARLEGAMVILGSATPSIETYYQAQCGKITLHELKNRPSGATLPEIHIVPLGTEFQKAQGFGLFSEAAQKALLSNFEKGEQSLVFINRRGYHALQQCVSCAEAVKCQNCSIPMTYHKKATLLICHFCGFEQPPPTKCQLCGHETMQFKGLGTQLVEAKLQRLIKDARILRIDKDTTAQKGSLDNYFKIFSSQGADVLVGTQMIAKGLDFSNLTLAIILNIDGTFNRPDFRAHEEAFQLMTQVAGRAGRSYLKGQVFIQSQNPMHPLCQKAKHSDYLSFYQHEIEERKLYSFPPFSRLMRFVFSDQDFNKLQTYAHSFRQLLTQNLPQDFMIEPLMSCFHEVIDKNYRYHFLIKGTQAIKLFQVIEWIDSTLKIPHSLKRLIDVDPQSTYF